MSIQQSKAAEFHNQTLGNSLMKNPNQNKQQKTQTTTTMKLPIYYKIKTNKKNQRMFRKINTSSFAILLPFYTCKMYKQLKMKNISLNWKQQQKTNISLDDNAMKDLEGLH